MFFAQEDGREIKINSLLPELRLVFQRLPSQLFLPHNPLLLPLEGLHLRLPLRLKPLAQPLALELILVVLPLLVVARLLLERLRDVARFAWPLVVVVVVPIIFNKFIEINLLK